ncbi:unnamed protein product, partial [Choristocarpus tenellus]
MSRLRPVQASKPKRRNWKGRRMLCCRMLSLCNPYHLLHSRTAFSFFMELPLQRCSWW